jgi:hypothetical protein
VNKNQGRILDFGVSAGYAMTMCAPLYLVDFHPVYVFITLVITRYGKLTLARRVQGLRNYIAAQQEAGNG